VILVQGFGVLAMIDVRATLKARRGIDVEDYVILGACDLLVLAGGKAGRQGQELARVARDGSARFRAAGESR
jgi:hypothetical protein